MKAQVDHIAVGKNPFQPCPDAALSGLLPVPHAVVADGCSASPGSAAGALILALCAARQIATDLSHTGELSDCADFGDRAIHRAAAVGRELGLGPMAMDATLLIACAAGGTVWVYAYGDGHIVTQSRSGAPDQHRVLSYDTNAPFYLSYRLDADRESRYRETLGGRLEIEDAGQGRVVHPFDAPVCYAFPMDTLRTVLLGSDGSGSFVDPEGFPVPSGDVVSRLSAFKHTQGAFIQRRVRRALREMQAAGIRHTDDISIAGIHLEDAS